MRGHYGYNNSHDPRVEGILDDVSDAFTSVINTTAKGASKVVSTAKGAGRGLYNAAKGAGKKLITFVHKPPAWFSVAFPLMTMENQRYWAGKVGGATGEQLYDAGVKAVAQKYLGPAGPALVETYNKITDDAVNGNLDALQIVQKAPQIVTLAIASKKGAAAFQEAVARTNSTTVAPTAVSTAAPAATTAGDYMTPYAPYPELSDEEAAAVMIGCGCTATNVGTWLPMVIGLPLAGAAGYLLRRWQEQNPGRTLPLVPPGVLMPPVIPPAAQSSAPAVTAGYIGQDSGYSDGYGDDTYDIDDTYAYDGAPSGDAGPMADERWLETVGAQVSSSSWAQSPTKALIDSAISEVTGYASTYPPAAAYVWSLEAPSSDPYAGASGSTVVLEGTTAVVPFSSQRAALDYLRQVAQSRPLALAMFERASAHWPNPTAWRKSDDPNAAQLIAQHVANQSQTQMGAWGSSTTIGTVVDDVRRRAQLLADKRVGDVIGVIHTSNDGLWHTLAFREVDDADDWLGTATQDPATFTYAAYFDKSDVQWPYPVNEKIGGARDASQPSSPIFRDPAVVSGRWGR